MGYLGRRIGLSQDTGNSSPNGSDVGGGILDIFTNGYFQRQQKLDGYFPPPPPEGLTATGGVISDYADPGSGYVWRSHIFTSSGTFDVQSIGNLGNTIEYLVIAGGGAGGGGYYSGGGGAGGLRTSLSGHPLATGNPSFSVTAGPTSYLVTVGGGGAGSQSPAGGHGLDGVPGQNSYFGPPVAPQGITAHGGGAGRGRSSGGVAGLTGGSGGGTAYGAPGAGGFGLNPSTPAPIIGGYPFYTPGTTEGNPGGDNPNSNYYGSGGGGAGGAAPPGPSLDPSPYGYPGGVGIQVLIAGPTNAGIGSTGPSTNYGYFAGGGGGGGPDNTNLGGYGGGGDGALPGVPGRDGQQGTGGGGGGGTINSPSGSGGSGIIAVRYRIAALVADAKATGGSISYYNGKTIHTFTSSGDFNNTSGSPLSAEVVLIGGGGGGGTDTPNNYGAGGGGAGGYYVNSAVTISTGPNTIVVGSGGASVVTTRDPAAPSPLIGGNGLTGGSTSAFGVTMGGGGGGTGGAGAPTPGGASGGGVTYVDAAPADFTGAPFPGTLGDTPPAGWGHAGGPGGPAPGSCPGTGGGGAGGAGNEASSPTPMENGSQGGLAIQLPATFRNPQASTGFGGTGPTTAPVPNGFDTSGKFWFAGGGGGSVVPATGTAGNRGAGGIGFPHPYPSATMIGPWGGAGDGINRDGNSPNAATSALANTGSGGGGYGYSVPSSGTRNHGGSGIVLIAYPS